MEKKSLHPTVEEIWRRYDADELRLTAPVSERMLDLAGLSPGMHILDLATGRGEPAIRAARRVAPDGRCLGTDVDSAMLRMARERADAEGVKNLDLLETNAETLEGCPTGSFDVVLARWGIMYFADPVAALRSARRALRPGGIFVAAFWAEPEKVSYFTLPRRVLSRWKTPPAIDPEAPGTFRFADPARIVRDYSAAGFSIESMEEMEIPVMEAADGAGLVAWSRAFGLGRLLADLPDAVQKDWEAALIAASAPLRIDGFYRLGGVTRLVVAR